MTPDLPSDLAFLTRALDPINEATAILKADNDAALNYTDILNAAMKAMSHRAALKGTA